MLFILLFTNLKLMFIHTIQIVKISIIHLLLIMQYFNKYFSTQTFHLAAA
jgi:hypothetical protein